MWKKTRKMAISFQHDYMLVAEGIIKNNKLHSITYLKKMSYPQRKTFDKSLDMSQLVAYLSALRKGERLKSKKLAFSIPNEHVIVRQHKLPNLRDQELRQIISSEVGESIHLPFEQPLIDFTKVPGTIDTEEGTCEIMLVAAPEDIVMPLVSQLHLKKWLVSAVDITGLCIYRWLTHLNPTFKSKTFLLIEFHEESIDFHIFDGGFLRFTRKSPIHIQELGVQHDHPDMNVPAYEDHPYFENYLADVTGELSRTINFYQYSLGYRDVKFESVMLTGYIYPTNRIAERITSELGVHCEWVHHYAEEYEIEPGFDAALGLLIKEERN